MTILLFLSHCTRQKHLLTLVFKFNETSFYSKTVAAPRGGLGEKSGEKRVGGGYDSGIKSRNTGLGKFQNKRHSCSNIYINM